MHRPYNLPNSPFRLLRNPRAKRGSPAVEAYLTTKDTQAALQEIQTWPDYTPTPLVELVGLCDAVGVGELWYKDEGKRLGVESFKPLGGAYAVSRILAREVCRKTGAPNVTSRELLSGRHRELLSHVTVTCATDGNHGRAVAWAAKAFGCRAVVFLASHVSPWREEAIASFGAEVVRTNGNHDEAVQTAAAQAARSGWFVVSETTNASSPDIARDVMVGYSTLMQEIIGQLGASRTPTHVFVQAGVGGLAAALAEYGSDRWGLDRPILVVVEAENADCVYQSIDAGRWVSVGGELDTIMAGLAAGEVSRYAWTVLERGADFCMTIPDEAAIATMQLLARAPFGDQVVTAGESGVAGLAAALVVCRDENARATLGIDPSSRILTIGTEGATDPVLYERIVRGEREGRQM
jgi:diaminopropionate ammonia-lyase